MSNGLGSASKLRLKIRNVPALENGVPTEIELDQRGLIIGRSATADWSLPDPRSHISSRHCEIVYRHGAYQLVDTSTNGTYLNNSGDKVSQPRTLADGDVIIIGHYEVVATLIGGHAGAPAPAAPAAAPGWQGWGPSEPVASTAADGWGTPAPMAATSGQGAMSGHWSPPTPVAPASSGWDSPAPAPSSAPSDGWGGPPPAPPSSGWGSEPAGSDWGAPAPTPSSPASGWSSPVGDSMPAPAANDVWGKLADTNVVDWARGGFGQPAPAPIVETPLGLGGGASLGNLPSPPPPAAAAPAPGPAPAPPPTANSGLGPLLAGAGLAPQDVRVTEGEALQGAGALLRRLVAGLVVMLEARARAKAQLGAQTTSLEFDGNNPIKFARTPEQALVQLLNPAERGFMPAERAIEDAFLDLQAHQVATLKAMQGALRATLDRFSPGAIRRRAEDVGVLKRILPGARDAALWQAYEKEFGGVAQGSDEAFMDVFAKEFKRAYEEQARKPKR